MMLITDAIYRFATSSNLRYYRAAQTRDGVYFLYPISVGGVRIADEHPSGRPYVILYFVTRWGKLAAAGYWLEPKAPFEKVYVTDAGPDDLELVAQTLDELPAAHSTLDDILLRHEVELDLDVWGALLAE